ncbi:MAG: hypothetical protein HC898_11320 [Phycisphaerales bacterium]|nr:hypothetical protein [Phycisphaerales bacterium]
MSGRGVWRGIGQAGPALFGLYLYLGSGLFATFVTAINTQWSLQWLYTQFTIVLMFTFGLGLVRSAKQIHSLIWLVVACLSYAAWVLNSQYYFDGFNRIWLKGFGGGDNNGGAMIFVMAVPVTFFLAIQEKRIWLKWLCLVGVLMQIHVVLMSFSRGSQLGLCIVGAAIFATAMLTLPRKGLTLLLAIVFVVLGLQLAGEEVRDRFSTIFVDKGERDASAASRFDTWKAALACIQDHPLGVGPRGFNLISHQYGLAPNKSVHNLFLQTGADYGLLGTAGLAFFYVVTMWKCFWLALDPIARRLVWPRFYGTGCCIALGGLMVCSQFIGMESIEAGYIIALLGTCTLCHVDRIRQVESQAELLPPLELEQVPVPGEEQWQTA